MTKDTRPAPYRVTPENPVFNALFYGDPGSGKTTLAASCQDHPSMKDVIFANIEGGLLSVSHRGDIHAVDVKSTQELENLYWDLKRGQYESVRTVVIDSATELQTVNLEEVVNDAMGSGKTASRRGRERTRDDIWQEDYGKSTVQLKRLFRWFKDMDMNVIVTALAKTVYPKVSEGVDMSQVEPLSVQPSLTAKLSSSLNGYMDFVWFLRFDPELGVYQALTQRDPVYFAKTRGLRFAEAIPQIVSLSPEGKDRFMMPEIFDLFCQTQSEGTKKKSRVKTK